MLASSKETKEDDENGGEEGGDLDPEDKRTKGIKCTESSVEVRTFYIGIEVQHRCKRKPGKRTCLQG